MDEKTLQNKEVKRRKRGRPRVLPHPDGVEPMVKVQIAVGREEFRKWDRYLKALDMTASEFVVERIRRVIN